MRIRDFVPFIRGAVASLLLVSLSGSVAARSLFVDQKAAGTGVRDGSSARPFLSIGPAAAIARPGDTVFVKAGIYRETVVPARSGLPGKPIVFRPFRNDTVLLRGTTPVAKNAWKQDEQKRWFASWPGEYISANNQSDQVFLDGRMINLARWPREKNSDPSHPFQAVVESVQASEKTDRVAPGPLYTIWRTTFTCTEFQEPGDRWVGAKIWMNSGNATDEQDGNGITGTVLSTDAATHRITVDLDARGMLGTERPRNFLFGHGSKFYLFNPVSVDGLINEGEWWRDRARGRLYVRMPGGTPPANHAVEVKQRDWAFNLDNRSYITVQGFRLFGASITTDNQSGSGKGNGDDRKGSVAPANHLILDGLSCEYVSHFTDQTGDLQTQWDQSSGIIVSGSDCIIRNCDIAWSAGCGLVLIGERNKALNNIVHDVGYNATDGGGIGLGVRPTTVSRDAEVAFNTVYNVGIDGIEFGALKNSDPSRPGTARIHHNVVHDAVLQSADSGGMHTFSSDGVWTRIDHNIVYSIGGPSNTGYLFFGIYLDYAPDDGKSPGRYIVDHNVIYNTPSPLNLNHANTVRIYNNTIISATLVARSSISSNGGTYEGVELKNNLGNTVYRGDLDESSLRAGKNRAVSRSNIINVSLEAFRDASNPNLSDRDYRLKSGTDKAADKGIDVAPFNDATPPDIGAYEAGQPKWKAGATRNY